MKKWQRKVILNELMPYMDEGELKILDGVLSAIDGSFRGSVTEDFMLLEVSGSPREGELERLVEHLSRHFVSLSRDGGRRVFARAGDGFSVLVILEGSEVWVYVMTWDETVREALRDEESGH